MTTPLLEVEDLNVWFELPSGGELHAVRGISFELEAGGLCHVEARTLRWFGNAGDTDLVLLIIGAHDGYAGRDGRMVDPADEERRRRQAEGGPLPSLTARPGTPPGRPR